MLLNKLKSKLNFTPVKNTVLVTEAFGDLQSITSIYYFLIHQKDTIIICKSVEEAKKVFNLAVNFFKIDNVIYFPDFNIEPYTQASADKVIAKTRIDALYSLINTLSPKLLVTTVLGLIFKTVSKDYLENKQLNVTVGKKLQFNTVTSFLKSTGYIKKDKVLYQGEYAVRGDIIDVYSANSYPARISFFGDIVENIKSFDVLSQRTNNNLESTIINLPLETALNEDSLNNFNNNLINYSSKEDIYNNVCKVCEYSDLPLGIEHYLPLLFTSIGNVLDYLVCPVLVFNNTNTLDIENIWQVYKDSYETRISKNSVNNNKKYRYLLTPKTLLLSKTEVESLIENFLKIIVNSTKYPDNVYEDKVISLCSKDIQYLININYSLSAKSKALIKLILHSKNIIFINLISSNSINYVTNLLVENNIPFVKVNNFYDFNHENYTDTKVFLVKEESFSNGFMFDNYIFICENDFFTNHAVHRKNTKIKTVKQLGFLKELTHGELLVHIKHGIGKYIGLTTLNNQGIEHDFLELEYSGKDKLYIPVENIDLLNKYGSVNSDTILDKLGSNSWERRKSSIKEKLHEIAYDLIKLAAVRNLKEGPQINANPDRYLEFVNAFPYIETDDQLSAIEDIKNDFKSNKVVDRLICGDVGFGKTEVAMRATFLTVASGYQVVILAPTTLLVRQHYYNFVNRFKGFPFTIKQLSRFISKKDRDIVKDDLHQGKVDIVIATHALLSKNIGFNKLGLLIVDEEQSFGVVHKEKIKTLKENIHTLSLTATPIPRTLQMALTGVKSLSIIATPPIDKLPIKTYTMPFDEVVIKEAILREVSRKGQVYFIAPFISELHELEKLLNSLNMNLKTLILHGQMDAVHIEDCMKDFQDNKFNVLLSTNIIESGIDLDNVNTIIVTNADKFGLSQLYQLRGRVGRGNIQSYAYITYSNVHSLTPNAKKRLEAIQNLDYLGAGFILAEHDLGIRGAGNILGKEQSGHIKGIGIELYNKFLAEEVNKLKLKNNSVVSYDSLSPNVKLPVVSLIPGFYINDIATRMEFYQKLANTNSFAEVELVKNELVDRFGKLPKETENLINLIKIKILCKVLSIEKLVAGTKALTVYFYKNKPLKTDEMLKYIQQNQSTVKLQKDLSVVKFFSKSDDKDIVRETFGLLFSIKSIFGLQE